MTIYDQGPQSSYKEDVVSKNEETAEAGEAKMMITERLNQFNQYRRERLNSMKANIAYLCGQQNIYLQNDQIHKLPESETTLSTCNLILPAVMNDIATSTKVGAKFDIVPNGDSEEDKATTKVSRKIFEYLERNNPRHLARGEAVLWYDIDGVGWRKTYWNSSKGPMQLNAETGEYEPIGDVTVECLPNNELIYDYRAKNLCNLDWIIHAKRVTKGWVRSRYGVEVSAEIQDSHIASAGENHFEATIMEQFRSVSQQVSPNSPQDTRSTTIDDDEMVDYYEYWHKPCMGLPGGALIILIGGTVVRNEQYPIEAYPHQELPFVPSAPVALNGVTIGSVPRISQARPMQREYNIIRSLIMSHVHVLGNGLIMAPRESNINFRTLTNIAGGLLEYDGIAKPSREPGVPLPNGLFAYLAEISNKIDAVFAFHEPTKGIMPSGGPRSAKGLEVLQGADFDQLGPIIDGFEEAEEKIVYQMIQIALANYTEGRTLKVIGENNEWATYMIDQEALNGKINVIVRRGSSMPHSRDAEAQKAFALWQSGLIGDPNDIEVRMHTIKEMQLGGTDGILKMYAKDTSFAKKEYATTKYMLDQVSEEFSDHTDPEQLAAIQMIAQVPPVNSFDNHEVHIKEHANFIKEYYHEWMAKDKKYLYAMGLMIEHLREHQDIISQAVQAQAEQQVEDEAYTKGNTEEQLMIKRMDFTPDGNVKKPESKSPDKK